MISPNEAHASSAHTAWRQCENLPISLVLASNEALSRMELHKAQGKPSFILSCVQSRRGLTLDANLAVDYRQHFKSKPDKKKKLSIAPFPTPFHAVGHTIRRLAKRNNHLSFDVGRNRDAGSP